MGSLSAREGHFSREPFEASKPAVGQQLSDFNWEPRVYHVNNDVFKRLKCVSGFK